MAKHHPPRSRVRVSQQRWVAGREKGAGARGIIFASRFYLTECSKTQGEPCRTHGSARTRHGCRLRGDPNGTTTRTFCLVKSSRTNRILLSHGAPPGPIPFPKPHKPTDGFSLTTHYSLLTPAAERATSPVSPLSTLAMT